MTRNIIKKAQKRLDDLLYKVIQSRKVQYASKVQASAQAMLERFDFIDLDSALHQKLVDILGEYKIYHDSLYDFLIALVFIISFIIATVLSFLFYRDGFFDKFYLSIFDFQVFLVNKGFPYTYDYPDILRLLAVLACGLIFTLFFLKSYGRTRLHDSLQKGSNNLRRLILLTNYVRSSFLLNFIYCSLLLIATLTFFTLFNFGSYLNAISGNIYLKFSQVFLFLLFLLLSCFYMSWIFVIPLARNWLRRRLPDHSILLEICCLLEILSRKEVHLYKSENLREASRSLENMAAIFTEAMTNRVDKSDYRRYVFIRKKFAEVGNYYQEMRVWLYFPGQDTRHHVIRELLFCMKCILDNDYNSLPQLEHSVSNVISRREEFTVYARNLLSLLVRMSLPFILIYVLETVFKQISQEAIATLMIGAFALAAINITVELDPHFVEKLNFIKQIKDLLSGRFSDK